MDGDARFLLAGGDDGLVHMVAVHSLSAVSGEQRRVQVEDTPGEGLHYPLVHEPHEAGEHHEVYPFGTQRVDHQPGVLAPHARLHVLGLHAVGAQALYHTGVRDIGVHLHHTQKVAAMESLDNVLGICAAAGGEYGYLIHCQSLKMFIILFLSEEERVKIILAGGLRAWCTGRRGL